MFLVYIGSMKILVSSWEFHSYEHFEGRWRELKCAIPEGFELLLLIGHWMQYWHNSKIAHLKLILQWSWEI